MIFSFWKFVVQSAKIGNINLIFVENFANAFHENKMLYVAKAEITKFIYHVVIRILDFTSPFLQTEKVKSEENCRKLPTATKNRFSGAYFMVAYPAAVLHKHPYRVFLTLVQIGKS